MVQPFVLTATTYLIYAYVHYGDPDNLLNTVRTVIILTTFFALQSGITLLPVAGVYLFRVSLIQIIALKYDKNT